ncbi:cordon-bleu protein-like 1 [Tachypleus tridentatus]|uniref:cordon-bleu protein-like 1 n=1 Tax=Tachypleus tridentatus TaxID=6853 RepID=UPI003FD2E7DE
MFKFMKTIKGQITSKTAPFESKPNARPNVKKTVSAPPVMKNILKLPVGNGTLPYNVTTVMTPNHGGDESAINELLEGQMELDVILPDGKKERVTVERSTQMIDLLVKVTTPYKIKPGEHMIQVFDEGGRDLIYKPSTYIGFLDTNTIFVVPKKKLADNKKLTFEQTSRLQIRLPHNQRIAYRFGPKITLDEIKQTVCREKNFNPDLYHLAHPNQMDVAMDGNITFEDYNFKEISLVSSKSIDVNSSQLESIKYPSHSDLVKKEETLSFGSNHSTLTPVKCVQFKQRCIR